MKAFETYQLLGGEELTERDKKQIGSKFWGQGKWDNFVLPHLPEDCSELSLVDMGCNAGLFLKFAKDKGFKKAIGVDYNRESVDRGNRWAKENGYDYKIIKTEMNHIIDDLPIVDYTVLANAHYYFRVADWLDYVDKLRTKSHRVIIVTTHKKFINRCWAEADTESIRTYFKDWKEVSYVPELPTEGDPDPRRMWSFCFESPVLEKVDIDSINCRNNVQNGLYIDLLAGVDYHKTKYYRILKKYRAKWKPETLEKFMQDKVAVFNSIKEVGQMKPLIYNKDNIILDGNHRHLMLKRLGYKMIFGRRT